MASKTLDKLSPSTLKLSSTTTQYGTRKKKYVAFIAKTDMQSRFSPVDIFTCLLLTVAIVVIIDVLRATSTITTALYNGCNAVIPVDSVAHCIELGAGINGITAGERDGKIAEGPGRR